ncbi:hypothetical protein Tco_1420188 [Tanacetum coccineum]
MARKSNRKTKISVSPCFRRLVCRINGGGIRVLITWDEYVVLVRELDTPYPMKGDTPYSTVDQNSFWKPVGYGVSKCWIRRIGDFLEHGYAVSSLMDTAYWSSE